MMAVFPDFGEGYTGWPVLSVVSVTYNDSKDDWDKPGVKLEIMPIKRSESRSLPIVNPFCYQQKVPDICVGGIECKEKD